MKIQMFVMAMIAGLAYPSHAFDHYDNPDRYASVGVDVASGKLPGILTNNPGGLPQTDGGYVRGLLDLRIPLTNVLTFHAFGSSTGINNNLQFSNGNEVGLGFRVYIR